MNLPCRFKMQAFLSILKGAILVLLYLFDAFWHQLQFLQCGSATKEAGRSS
jgi:hypothetical protein